jgi:MFS family permease
MAASRRPASTSPLRVLSHRNFWPYFTGNLLSNCGTWFQNLAQAIFVYRLTGSTFLVGVVNFAQFAGVFVLAPWAGSAADRFDRRRLLIVTQVGAVFASGLLALLASAGLATTPVVIVMALFLGLTTAFAVPAMQALVPLLVERDELSAGIALNSLTFNLARAVGPVLAAIVIGQFGVATAFGLNALSYVALIAGLAMVHPSRQQPATAERPRLRDSIQLVRRDARLMALLGTIAALSLTVDPVTTLTPGFAKAIFHHSDSLAGFLVGAFGAGAVLAAVTVAGRRADATRQLPLTCLVLGAGILGFALSPTPGWAYLALAIAGVGYLMTNTIATTAVQLEVEDAQRGRIMALWSIAFLGLRPFGSLLDGGVAQTVGLRAGGVVMSVPIMVAGIVLLRFGRRFIGKMGGPVRPPVRPAPDTSVVTELD